MGAAGKREILDTHIGNLDGDASVQNMSSMMQNSMFLSQKSLTARGGVGAKLTGGALTTSGNSAKNENIRVYLRMRPFNQNELSE